VTSQPTMPLPARLFDGLLVLASCVVLLVVGVGHVSWADFEWQLLAVVPVVGVLAHYPIVLLRRNGGLEIGLDSAVLVFLTMTATLTDAIVVWAFATVLVQMLVPRRKTLATRLFNTGLCTLAGTAAIIAMWAVAPMGTTGLREILAFLVGCAVYFAVDFGLTGVSLALTFGDPMRKILLSSAVPLTLLGFLGVNSLGWLAGITLRYVPAGLPLIAVPFIAVITAMRAFALSHRERKGLRVLFETSLASQAAVTADDVQEVLLSRATELLRCESVTIGDRGPDEDAGEVGAQLNHGEGPPLWLVAAARINEPYDAADLAALNTLATVGAESLRRAELTAAMTRMARSDALTGLDNRAVLRERLGQALARVRDDGRTVGVIYLDLDGFKAVNDTLGHDAGDDLLLQVADRLRSCVRAGDTVARMGGDEFAVLVEPIADAGAVEATAHRLLETIGEPIDVLGTRVHVGASVGYTVRTGSEDVTDMLQRADMAMYSVKESGKQGVAAFAPEMFSRRTARLVLRQELARAVEEGQLRVHYQPVMSLQTGLLDGVEALVRWQHPTRGLLGPGDFIDVAEESGLIEDVGRWVLQQSWRDAEQLGRSLGRQLSVAVNIAARQLDGAALLDAVAALPTDALHPSLVLELTERDLVSDVDRTEVLQQLRGLGCKIAVDDFGTGYSSFAYLRNLPVDILKLDRQFVVDAADDPRAVSVIRAVTAMAHTLGLVSVAEGVETQEQADVVTASGCELAQGYLFARPMPVGDLMEQLVAAAA
jgi:diguanylate cyclase (GGDEF)-like protein